MKRRQKGGKFRLHRFCELGHEKEARTAGTDAVEHDGKVVLADLGGRELGEEAVGEEVDGFEGLR